MPPPFVEQVSLPGRSAASGDLGAVTAMTRPAARAGAGILAAGGNAADAAVAAALVAGVVEPAMSGLGGAAYAVVFDPRSGRTTALEGGVRCPGRATGTLFEPLVGVGGGLYGFPPTRGDRAETGALSVCVPTAPAVLARLHERFGSLPFSRVAEPALALAAEGFVPDWMFVLHAAAGYRRLARCPAALSLWTREDGAPFVSAGPDDRLRLPELAAALRRLAEEGAEPFYAGDPGRRLVEGTRAAGGILEEADLRVPAVREGEPLEFRFRGRRLATLPGPSGGPTLAAALAHLDAFPEAAFPEAEFPEAPFPETGPSGDAEAETRFLHLAAEALRLAYEDRFRHLGDPDHAAGPWEALLDPAYLAARREGVSPEGPRLAEPAVPDPWALPGADRPAPVPVPVAAAAAGDCTTHLNAMDRTGLSVSLTATLGGRFGSAFTVPGLGYPLNNGMMWFDPRPGRLISPGPGKRALHAAAPTLVFPEHRDRPGGSPPTSPLSSPTPVAALGAPGGRRLISAVALTAARHLGRGAPIREAAMAPGLHTDQGPVFLDERTPECDRVAAGLRARGHRVVVCEETGLTGHFGRGAGIARIPAPPGSGGNSRFEVGVDAVRTAAGAAVRSTGPA